MLHISQATIDLMLQFHRILLIVSDRRRGLKGKETDRDKQILKKRKMLQAT